MHRVIVLLVALAGSAGASAQAPNLKAGAFAIDVTPLKFPISVNGGMTDRQATMANDRLHARCLVLDDGRTKLALVVVDNCMIPRELMVAAKMLAAKKTGIPATNMLISATHTHSAPTVTCVFQSDPDEKYVAYLAEKIAEGIERAHDRREPAKIGWASADNVEQVFVRRWKREQGFIPADPFGNTTDRVQMNPGYQVKGLVEPAGVVDPQMSVLAAKSLKGKPIALFANYSLHYVGGNPELYRVAGQRLQRLPADSRPA